MFENDSLEFIVKAGFSSATIASLVAVIQSFVVTSKPVVFHDTIGNNSLDF